ncbi:MAG: hydrogenase maturation protein [Pararhodobacter sp.]
MRVLLLTQAFNSLSQRLWLELTEAGHEVAVEFDVNDAATRRAIDRVRPDLLLAPFLKRAIPTDVWRALPCLVVHPGPPGDKGPSALDRAVQEGAPEWGVTVVQAVAEMDAGPVWAHRRFPMRAATKSSLYRREVTEAAVSALTEALERFERGLGPALPDNGPEPMRPALPQAERAIDWGRMTTAEALARIRAADGMPGVRDELEGHAVWLHDAHPAQATGAPGALIGRGDEAILRATADGAVWIGQLRVTLPGEARTLKLPAVEALRLLGVALPPRVDRPGEPSKVEAERHGDIALIRFPFHNGAMNLGRCRALEAAIRQAAGGDARSILLTGGAEFWSNGIDLATIEASDSPAETSMELIEAIDDVCLALLEARDKWVVSLMRGNAGAGGVFMALAADEVLARDGVVLNPHYKNMGNLYGSEYWTYLLPRRLGHEGARAMMETRLPLSARGALKLGLIDGLIEADADAAEAEALSRLRARLDDPGFARDLAEKQARRDRDEAQKPLARYRAEELERMRLNFFGFDTSYHVARYNFITKVPKSRTPNYLARLVRTG